MENSSSCKGKGLAPKKNKKERRAQICITGLRLGGLAAVQGSATGYPSDHGASLGPAAPQAAGGATCPTAAS